MKTCVPTKSLKRLAADLIPTIDRRLNEAYQTASLGNKADPLDELIYIQLSIRTREGAYSDIYSLLHRRVRGDWAELLVIPEAEIINILHGGGMAEVKLGRLKAQIERIIDSFGSATLEPLRDRSDKEAENYLRSLPGVGPKAARCVLLYSLDRQVFPVDGHCRRVLTRLGFCPPRIDRKAANDFLQELVPPTARHSLHVNLVHHGRALCLPVNPRCDHCVVLPYCAVGQNRISGRKRL